MTLGAIIALTKELPRVQTPECEQLIQEAAATGVTEVPDWTLPMFLTPEGQVDIRLMHSSEPDRGTAGI